MLSDRKGMLLISFYAIAIIVVHLLRPGGAEFYDSLTTAINVVTVLVPIAIGIVAARHFGLSSFQGRSVSLITAALVLWLAADMLWLLSEEAIVSIADAFYLAGYPVMMVAIVYGIRTISHDLIRDTKKMALLSLVSIILVAIYLSFFPFSWDPEITLIENVLIAGYVVADIVLLIPTVFLVSQAFSGTFSRPWMLIAGANILNLLADVFYNINYETYAGGDLIDVVWYVAYLLYGAAFIMMRHETEKITSVLREKGTGQKKPVPSASR